MDQTALRRQLLALRERFIGQLPARAADLAVMWGQRHHGVPDARVLALMRVAACNLKGAAGIYDIAPLAATAEALDTELTAAEGEGWLAGDRIARIDNLLAKLSHQAGQPPAEDHSPHLDGGLPPALPPGGRGARPILLLTPDPAIGEELIGALAEHGYPARLCADLNHLAEALADGPAGAVITDLDGTDPAWLNRLRLVMADQAPPVIALASDGGLPARLAAVRAQVQGYLTRPVDLVDLVTLLDRLLLHDVRQPYRVVLVDDDSAAAAFYATLLRAAGILVWEVGDPLTAAEVLAEAQPDVLILDMYMPECSGTDLAAALRQQPAHAGLPIVFLSSEQDGDRQLEAIARGGDDFLTKPIRPDRLIAAVIARAERWRQIRALVKQDPLTRLLNQTALRERLEAELSRARRMNHPVAFALIDVDHFKQVNDTHGHPEGDQVLRRLARLMRQRLRRYDAVGRYGGEEFGLILPEATLADACKVVEQLRDRFAALSHGPAEAPFTVTFSAGVAGLPGPGTSQDLINAADQAMYAAKRGGRNRVVTAEATAPPHDHGP